MDDPCETRGYFLECYKNQVIPDSDKGYLFRIKINMVPSGGPFLTLIFAFFLLLTVQKVKSQDDGDFEQQECSNVENGIDMCNYITNEELKRQIQNLYDKYSSQNLIKIGTIGKSVRGEDLTYLKITSNVNSTRPLLKPMFK